MPDTRRQLLISVALDVPPEPSSGFFGHEIVYQHALVDAARQRGVDAIIAVPHAAWRDDPEVECLTAGGGSWPEGLAHLLVRSDGRDQTVVFYEADLAVLEVVQALARQHPAVVFIVNLFHGDPELAFPHLSQRDPGRGLHLRQPGTTHEASGAAADAGVDLPPNLLVFADTDRRRILAVALGIGQVATWPLYSVVEADAPPSPHGTDRSAVRITIPIAGWQVTRQLLYEIAVVIGLLKRYAPRGLELEWYAFGGGFSGGLAERSRKRRIRRLRRLGVQVEPAGLDPARYRDVLRSSDLVWLPQRGFYTTQSSGKAADALVCGTPILAPNGSFPAQEMARWVPGAPSYSGAREAVEVLLRADTVLPALKASLEHRATEIRRWYSPQRSVAVLLEAAEAVRDGLAARPTESLAAVSSRPAPPSEKHSVASLSGKLRRRARFVIPQVAADLHELWVRVKAAVLLR